MSVKAKEITIELPHITLAGLQWGQGENIRLGLHGWLDNAMSFAPIAPYLIDQFHSLLVFDFAGHGRSAHRPTGSGYFFTDYMRDTMLAVEHLGLTRLDVIGHSMGASLATLLAGIYAEQFKRLVCIECYGPPFVCDHYDMVQRMRERLTRLDYVNHQARTLHKSLPALVKARMKAGFLNWNNAAMIIKRNTEKVDGCYRFINDRRLRMSQPLLIDEAQVLHYIEHISAPVLVIEGKQGYIPLWPHLKTRYAHTRDIEVVSMQGGHHLHMDSPEQVGEVIQRFWQRTQ